MQNQTIVSTRLVWHVAVLAAVILVAWLFIDFREFGRALANAHWPWVILVMGLSTLDRFLMAGKWLQLLRYLKSTATFGAVLGAYYQVAFLERFIPSSLTGDALRAVLIARRFQGSSQVLATMVVEKLVAMLAAIVLALVGLGFLLTQRYDADQLTLFVLVPSLLVATLAGLRISLHRPFADRVIRFLPMRLQTPLASIYDHYSSFRNAPLMLSRHFLYCVVEQTVQVLIWLTAALAIEVATPVTTLFAVISVAQCVRKFAMLLDGWVLGEFSMVIIGVLFGVPQTQVLAFSFLAHASAVVASLPGVFLFSSSAIRLTEFRRARHTSGAARQAPIFHELELLRRRESVATRGSAQFSTGGSSRQ